MITTDDLLAILRALAAEQTDAIGVKQSEHTPREAAEFLADQACAALQTDRDTLARLLSVVASMATASRLQTTHHATIAGLILGARVQRAIADNAHLEATA